MTATKADAQALTAAQSTDNLVLSLRVLDTASTPEERMVRAWIIDELEKRYPAASAAVQAAFEADEALLIAGVDTPGVDYTDVLVTAIRKVR